MSSYRLIKWKDEDGILIGFEIVPESDYQKIMKEDLEDLDFDSYNEDINNALKDAKLLEGPEMDVILNTIGNSCGVVLIDELMTELGI